MTLPPRSPRWRGSKLSLQTDRRLTGQDPELSHVSCTEQTLWVAPLGENVSEVPLWPLPNPGLDEKIPSPTSQARGG